MGSQKRYEGVKSLDANLTLELGTVRLASSLLARSEDTNFRSLSKMQQPLKNAYAGFRISARFGFDLIDSLEKEGRSSE